MNKLRIILTALALVIIALAVYLLNIIPHKFEEYLKAKYSHFQMR